MIARCFTFYALLLASYPAFAFDQHSRRVSTYRSVSPLQRSFDAGYLTRVARHLSRREELV